MTMTTRVGWIHCGFPVLVITLANVFQTQRCESRYVLTLTLTCLGLNASVSAHRYPSCRVVGERGRLHV